MNTILTIQKRSLRQLSIKITQLTNYKRKINSNDDLLLSRTRFFKFIALIELIELIFKTRATLLLFFKQHRTFDTRRIVKIAISFNSTYQIVFFNSFVDFSFELSNYFQYFNRQQSFFQRTFDRVRRILKKMIFEVYSTMKK